MVLISSKSAMKWYLTSDISSIFRFLKLPAFVRMIVTSRPEAEVMFKDWKPTLSIKPDENNNMEDMEKLLEAKITACKSIKEGLRPKAVEVILKKSMVRINDAHEYEY